MARPEPNGFLRLFPALLRGEPEPLTCWLDGFTVQRAGACLLVVAAGGGLFGAAVGLWRDPWQAVYAAVKLPLVVLLTTLGNALLNGMLAPLLGLNLGLRQSLGAILMSHTIAAAILGAFSPLMLFLIWNLPPLDVAGGVSRGVYSFILVLQAGVIAFAGVTANLRLYQLLLKLGGSRAVAGRVLFGWLAGNLLLGSQLSWNLRPFVGSPNIPVQFLREHAFTSNFFEAIWNALKHLLS
jgi:hypothetical protein